MTNQINTIQTIERLIRARYPIIVIVSHEETRVLDALRKMSSYYRKGWENAPRRLYEWAISTGVRKLHSDEDDKHDTNGLNDPQAVLQWIAAYEPVDTDQHPAPTLFVMKDLHGELGGGGRFDPVITRCLRDVAARFISTFHTLVLLSPVFAIPPELEKTVAMVDWPLPDYDELKKILDDAVKNMRNSSVPVNLDGCESTVVEAMRGLSAFEAESALIGAIVEKRALTPDVVPAIVKEKSQIIRKAGVLEFIDTAVTMSQVGGLDHLKMYAAIKRSAFSAQAHAAGVDAPRGVLLVGVPGTGKSLAAKAIAGGQMPLLRMDIGALMGGIVGQSEGNMRSALKVAEAVSPCVLWIDEIEKSLGGNGGELDGGTSLRVLGTILTWMQETTAPVYVVATANDVRSLRPELIRRFDDIFWVDLPALKDRKAILAVHLEKRGKGPAQFDLDRIARTLREFTGAEIEKVVKSAIETAFFDGTPLSESHLLAAAGQIVPVSRTMSEQISTLRAWAAGKARAAGEPMDTESDVPEMSGQRASAF